MSNYHIYGIGAALVDTEIEVTDHDLAELGIEKGLMTLVDEERQHQLINYLTGHLIASRRSSGGSAANSIIAASYFGARTFYSCKVSDDHNGDFYLNDMSQAGVTCNRNDQLHQGITGKCLVLITPDAERTMLTHLGISETLSVNELYEDAACNSDYVYLEGYLVTSPGGKAAAIRLREVAERHGRKTAISLSDPGIVEHFGSGLKEMIGNRVSLLFCNEHEAQHFTGHQNIDKAAEAMKKYAETFAITLGKQGAIVYDGNQYHRIAGVPVKAINTNGAGDMFAGAFLYAVTHGHNFELAGRFASRAAAEVVKDHRPRLRPDQHDEVKQEIFR